MINKFLKIEEKYDLFNEEIDDFNFWNFIRFGIYREIEYQLGYADAMTSLKKKRNVFSLAKKLMFNSLGSCRKKTDVVLTCLMNHKTENGKYSNIYFEQITKSLNKSFMVIEQKVTYFKKNEYEINNVYSYLGLDMYIKFYKLMTRNPVSFISLSENFKSAIKEINDTFSCDVNHEMIRHLIYNCFIRWKVGKKYFRKTFEIIKPKVVLEICSYGLDNMIINEIAKELKIPTIEFQHGIMGEGHLAYNFSKKQNLPNFPDYIFTYSDFWNKTTRFPIPDEKVIATGFPYIEKIIKKSKTSDAKTNENSNIKNILIISQWTIAKTLSEFAVELYDYLEKTYDGEFLISYKLHPADNLNNVESFGKISKYLDKIRIIKHNEKSLYDCFLETDIQIGVNSTGIYEGLAFGLKTFLLKAEGSERMQALVDNGYAKYVEYPEDVDISKSDTSNINSSDFWKENALNNIFENIDIIMKEE